MNENKTNVNPMCKSCACFGDSCKGTDNAVWKGCVYKKPLPRKMSQLFTAYYSDRRTAYEKPLDWIYAHQNGASVEIRPTIWLWKAEKAPVFFVDYVGDGIGCTLATFDNLRDAEEFSEKVASMEEKAFKNWLINDRWAKKEA